MTILTRQEKINNDKELYDALQGVAKNNSIIEASVVGKLNTGGQVVASPTTAQTQYDILTNRVDALGQQIILEQASLSTLDVGYTQLKNTDVSIVYGCRSMNNAAGARAYSSELGTPATSTFIYALLSSVLKIYKTSTGASLPDNQRGFKYEPTFLPNVKCNFINSPLGLNDEFIYSIADYAGQDFMIFAVKNPTGTSKTFNFDCNGMAYSSYSRLVVSQTTPSIPDNLIYAGNPFTITTTMPLDVTSSSSGTNRTTPITVPAGFSSIIVFQSTIRYITTNTAVRDSYVRNLKTNLEAQGLLQNSNIMEIFRRVINGQRINQAIDFTALTLVEDVFKYICGSLIPYYATNNDALTAGAFPSTTYYNTTLSAVKIVLQQFATNASALAGGLSVGELYFNTTSNSEVLVTP